MQEYYDFIFLGKEIPEKSFLLTFDDGRKDSYYPVDPILENCNYNAVMFVIGENLALNSNYYLSKIELKRMINSGRWEVQSHTKEGQEIIEISKDKKKGHFLSNKKWIKDEQRIETESEFVKRIENDLFEAKEILENELKVKIYSLAYPYGDYGQRSLNFPKAKNILPKIAKKYYPVAFYQINPHRNFIENFTG